MIRCYRHKLEGGFQMRSDSICLLTLASVAFLLGAVQASVVINEVEQNPPGDENAFKTTVQAWFELYNNDDKEVNIGGWVINTSEGRSMTIPESTVIKGLDYYVSAVPSHWLSKSGEVLILKNETGAEEDRTPVLSDVDDNELAWTRDPDGRDTNSTEDWKFLASSSGF
jgi:hypothetical protein